MARSIDDLVARADELADEFEGYAPQEADRGEPARQRYGKKIDA